MVRNLIFLLLFIFIGCEMNSKQIIKPEKFTYDELKFNSVSKKLLFDDIDEHSDVNDLKKIITYWYDNKIKTDGFDGNLLVNVKKMEIDKIKEPEYFKISIDLGMQLVISDSNLERKKTYNLVATEYGEINGSFSINDQENLSLNIMHQALNSISKKLLEIN